MAVQQPIAFAFNQAQVGRTLDVLIDAPAPEGKNMWLGRTYADCSRRRRRHPGCEASHVRPGDMVECEIVGAEGLRPDRPPASTSPPKQRKARPRPRRKPRIVAGDPRWHVSNRSSAAIAEPSRSVGFTCLYQASRVTLMSRAEDRFAMVAPAYPEVLERPEHVDRQPAGAGGLRVRSDRIPVLLSGRWCVFVIAAATDALDGYFARLLKQDTPHRPAARPLDRQGDRFGLLHLPGDDPGHRGRPWMVTAIVVRELLIQGLRSHLEGQGQAVRRPDGGQAQDGRPVPSISAVLLCLGLEPSASPAMLWARDGLTWLAVALTLYSGCSYVWIAIPRLRGEA